MDNKTVNDTKKDVYIDKIFQFDEKTLNSDDKLNLKKQKKINKDF